MGCKEAKRSPECLREGNEGSRKGASKFEINLYYVDRTLGVPGANKLGKFASKFWPPPEKIGKNTKNSAIDSYL